MSIQQNPNNAETRLVTLPSNHWKNDNLPNTVKLYWMCPECGKPRGDTKRVREYIKGRVISYDTWKNPCGHAEHYSHVRLEAISNGLNETSENQDTATAQPAPTTQASQDYSAAPKRVYDAETRFVTIPARDDHSGLLTVTVKLHWTCPECGKPRGEVYRAKSYDGSLALDCDAWRNPCGHVDKYSYVRLEAQANGLNETGENSATATAPAAPATKAISNYRAEPKRVSLDEIIKQQEQERGLAPMPLETDLLLKRIAQGGHSGRFLADAFLSAYRRTQAFNHSLCELNNLDAEGFRLFHECLHIRHVPGWSDEALYQLEQRVKTIIDEGQA